jgi:eukaryotic-like serine/threonine-protein kinase
MPSQQSACDEARLSILLNAAEDSAEFQSLAVHVESCKGCQRKLSVMAADHTEWSDIAGFLSDDELDFEVAAAASRAWHSGAKNPSGSTAQDALARQVLSPASHPEMLGRLGRYEVERLIGSGGMGIVFKAFDTELNRPVAIKVLAPHLAGSGAARKRFAREARAAAAVVHEHVVAIHNVESNHEPPFLVMQYIAGESLQGRLNAQGPLELCEILRIAFQTAAGLAAAHAQGLVHRDVKPSNILLENTVDRALLTDFGLARASDDASLTHSGCLPGTPHYMSPEQARGESAGAQSDLFSLGSVIYAMCTGHPPFRAETAYGSLRRITDSEPRSIREQNPEVPDWLEKITFKLLAKKPAERFASAGELAELLEQCLAHVQQPTTAPLPEFCRPKHRRPKRILHLVAMALVLLIAVLIGLIIAQPWSSPASTGDASAGDNDPPRNVNTPASEPIISENPLAELDHAHRQLRDLQQEVNDLEAEIHKLW